MKTFLASFLAACLALTAAAAEKSAVPFRALDLEAAKAAAGKEGKIVFIDFYTTWCGPCKMLDAQTWTDAAVGRLLAEKTVPLKLDAEKEGLDAAKRYKINAYPTLLLLKPDGTEVDRIVGFREPAKFIEEFSTGLAGKPAIVRSMDAVSDAANDHDRVQARMNLGRQLAREGKNAEALAEWLWCYDEGMLKVSSFAGVRTSFLLGDIGRLARAYPPAREALLDRAAESEKRMLESGDRQAANEFAALCNALQDNTRLMAAFDRLAPTDPLRRAFGLHAFRILLPQHRYAEALSALPYGSMENLVNATLRRELSLKDPALIESTRRHSLDNLLDYIEVLAGAKDAVHADAMIKTLREFDASPEMEAKLAERLKRARGE